MGFIYVSVKVPTDLAKIARVEAAKMDTSRAGLMRDLLVEFLVERGVWKIESDPMSPNKDVEQ